MLGWLLFEQYVALCSQFYSSDMIFWLFFLYIQWHFSKLKKREFGIFNLG